MFFKKPTGRIPGPPKTKEAELMDKDRIIKEFKAAGYKAETLETGAEYWEVWRYDLGYLKATRNADVYKFINRDVTELIEIAESGRINEFLVNMETIKAPADTEAFIRGPIALRLTDTAIHYYYKQGGGIK